MTGARTVGDLTWELSAEAGLPPGFRVRRVGPFVFAEVAIAEGAGWRGPYIDWFRSGAFFLRESAALHVRRVLAKHPQLERSAAAVMASHGSRVGGDA